MGDFVEYTIEATGIAKLGRIEGIFVHVLTRSRFLFVKLQEIDNHGELAVMLC